MEKKSSKYEVNVWSFLHTGLFYTLVLVTKFSVASQ